MLNFLTANFTNRELAMGSWLIILFCIALCSKIGRQFIKDATKAILIKPLIISFIILATYTCCITLLFSVLPFYNVAFLKDIIIWFLFIGISTFYGVVTNKDEKYLKNIIFRNLKFIVPVEFIINSYTFGFVCEVILVFFVTLITILIVVSEATKQAEVTNRLNWILSIIGFFILSATILKAINDISIIGNYHSLISFLIPIVYSAFYILITYLFMVYLEYDMIFKWMGNMTGDNKKEHNKKKYKLIKVCFISFKKVHYFNLFARVPIHRHMPDDEYDALIETVKNYRGKGSE